MHRFFNLHQLPWILLWIGLSFLIVLLLVMIRTNWGQSHPLRKCAGLSLLVHLMLLCYATTVEIVTATGNVSHGSLNVTLVDGSADGVDDPSALATDDDSGTAAPDVLAAQNPKQTPTPPPLLDAPKVEPTEKAVAEAAPEPPKESVAKEETPPVEAPATEPIPATPTHAATAVAAEAKPADKPTEPLPPVEAAATLPKLPEPAQTPNDAQWVSGDPSGTAPQLSQPVLQGPITNAAADANQSSSSTANNGETKPLVEVAAAPIASRAVPEMYADRLAADRLDLVRQRGGTAESESAVQAALRWLAANQSADGRWDADKFGAGQEHAVLGQDRQGAGAHADTGMTGLALLAFLGAGNTHQQGPYTKTVQRGLEFLISIQGKDGNLAGEAETYAFMYSHGMATFALCEAYAMTGDKRLEPAVKAAIGYTLNGQIKSSGGWRYRQIESPGERGDTSQLGWQWMAIKSAELAGIEIPPTAREGAVKFLGSVTSGASGGKASYRPGERPTRTMTAEALACRQFMGMPRDNAAANEAGDFLMQELPSATKINLYYWYYGTLSMYQMQGPHWDRWNQALQNTLVRRQRVDGDVAGSWDPECIWAGYGGRIYSTAVSALCLEVYYRYLPIYHSPQERIVSRPSP